MDLLLNLNTRHRQFWQNDSCKLITNHVVLVMTMAAAFVVISSLCLSISTWRSFDLKRWILIIAAVTNYCQHSGLKPLNFIVFELRMFEIQNESHCTKVSVLSGWCSLWMLRGESTALPFPESRGDPYSLAHVLFLYHHCQQTCMSPCLSFILVSSFDSLPPSFSILNSPMTQGHLYFSE